MQRAAETTDIGLVPFLVPVLGVGPVEAFDLGVGNVLDYRRYTDADTNELAELFAGVGVDTAVEVQGRFLPDELVDRACGHDVFDEVGLVTLGFEVEDHMAQVLELRLGGLGNLRVGVVLEFDGHLLGLGDVALGATHGRDGNQQEEDGGEQFHDASFRRVSVT